VSDKLREAIPGRSPGFGSSHIDNALYSIMRNWVSSRGNVSSSSSSFGREIGEFVKGYLESWAANFRSRGHTDGALEEAIEETILSQQEEPGAGEIFLTTAKHMIEALCNLVWIDRPERVAYLSPIVNLCGDQRRLVVSTLNYDNAVERLAESNGMQFRTGIEEWPGRQQLNCEGDGIILLKLHGSIDWQYEDTKPTDESPLPLQTIRRVTSEEAVKENMRPAVIFGQRNKLTAEGPFLDILRQFKLELDQANLLTVIGYSFADDHINEFIARWLNAAANHQIRIVDPEFAKNADQFAKDLLQRCPQRITVIAKKAEDALPELFPAKQSTIAFSSGNNATQATVPQNQPPIGAEGKT
jgi:hypothetical protein